MRVGSAAKVYWVPGKTPHFAKSALLLLSCFLVLAAPALGQTCPGTRLTNGNTADANQVMQWFDCKAPLLNPAFSGALDVNSGPGSSLGITAILEGGDSGSSSGTALQFVSAYGGGTAGIDWKLGTIGAVATQFGYGSGSSLVFQINTGSGVSTQTEVMRISAPGNVGIGAAAPNSPLTVARYQTTSPGYVATFSSEAGSSGVAGNQVNISNTSASWGTLVGFDGPGISTGSYHGPNAAYLINVANGALYLGTNNSTSVTISATGLVGINAPNPTQTLEVGGSLAVDYLPSGGSATICVSSSVTGLLVNCSSSIRYKENVHSAAFGLSEVMAMHPVTFKWKGRDENDLGLIAEEVAKINPLFVTYKNGEIEGVKYPQLTAVLANAIKDQQKQINDLRGVNTSQATQIRTLEKRENVERKRADLFEVRLMSVERAVKTRTAKN
jgi:hypothetical protein